MFRKILAFGTATALGIAVFAATSSSARAHPPRRSASAAAAPASSFVPSAPAVTGSGKGIKIGYLSNDEAVPIVHVISHGIEAQAKRPAWTWSSATGR